MRRLLQRARRGLRFTGRKVSAVAATLKNMVRHNRLERAIDLLKIFQYLLEDDSCEVLASAGFVPVLDERAGERVERAYEYVLRHFSEPLDYEAIARGSGLSLSAFCRCFKHVTGRTLSDFVNEIRVGHARKLLIETDKGIAEIAYASGFGSLSNFNAPFRRSTGLNPRAYRRQYRAESQKDRPPA